jgi:hypothetical protein
LIDLHTHTTASDGRCSPTELVARAATAGVRVLGVTDHDTVAACHPASAACRSAGIEFVPAIEITAVRDGLDVHTLGYFIDVDLPALTAFLGEQRMRRVNRLHEIGERLRRFGIRLDLDAIVQPAVVDRDKAVGRPWIARAMVKAGHVSTVAEAFDRWLAPGRPAFVPRVAASPEEVIDRIHEAGGVASIAHPGLLGRDEWLPGLVGAGLDAIEVYHPDHDPATTARYLDMAAALGVAVSGGSDYHADESHGGLGSVSLPQEAYQGLIRAELKTRSSKLKTSNP